MSHFAQRRQNHGTKSQPNDKHAQTQRGDRLITPKLGHYLCIRARIEGARASDAQARARDDEHDDPLVQSGHALRASRVIVSGELHFEVRGVVIGQLL